MRTETFVLAAAAVGCAGVLLLWPSATRPGGDSGCSRSSASPARGSANGVLDDSLGGNARRSVTRRGRRAAGQASPGPSSAPGSRRLPSPGSACPGSVPAPRRSLGAHGRCRCWSPAASLHRRDDQTSGPSVLGAGGGRPGPRARGHRIRVRPRGAAGLTGRRRLLVCARERGRPRLVLVDRRASPRSASGSPSSSVARDPSGAVATSSAPTLLLTTIGRPARSLSRPVGREPSSARRRRDGVRHSQWLSVRSHGVDDFFDAFGDRPEDVIISTNGFFLREGGPAYGRTAVPLARS